MACLLQPECNFLHSYFRCKLPVEVVDMEVKVTSMEGTHIFRRDRMTQLIRCVPWNTKLHPHPNIIKKMKTLLDVENKMGPIIPALVSQFRSPFWKPILTSGKMIPQKKEGEHQLRKHSDQSPLKAPWHTLPYHNCSCPQGYCSMPSLSTYHTKTY